MQRVDVPEVDMETRISLQQMMNLLHLVERERSWFFTAATAALVADLDDIRNVADDLSYYVRNGMVVSNAIISNLFTQTKKVLTEPLPTIEAAPSVRSIEEDAPEVRSVVWPKA